MVIVFRSSRDIRVWRGENFVIRCIWIKIFHMHILARVFLIHCAYLPVFSLGKNALSPESYHHWLKMLLKYESAVFSILLMWSGSTTCFLFFFNGDNKCTLFV